MNPWPLFVVLAFLSGSIPFGLLIARSRGIDIRRHGSRNIGATNVGRVLGKKWGLLCFGLDLLKGMLPTLGAGLAMGTAGRSDLSAAEAAWWLGVVVGAVLGHVFTPWLGFRGGKGVATGLGAMLGVFPVLTVAGVGAFVVWGLALAVWRYVSLASCLAAASLPIWVWVGLWAMDSGEAVGAGAGGRPTFVAGSTVLALLVIAKHRGNIARLLAGTEPKTGRGRARGG